MADNTEPAVEFIPHTVIGTPGRILDLVSQGQLPMTALERLVLDEADQALSLPNRYATKKQRNKRINHPKPAELLLDQLSNQKHQTFVSSATLNRPLRFFLTKEKGWLYDPLFIDVVQGSQLDSTRNETVQHHCLVISDDSIRNIQTNKEVLLTEKKATFDDLDDRMIESVAILQDVEPVRNGILFIDPTVSVALMKQKLSGYDIDAQDIKDYQPNTTTLWIATEFTARGVDIPGVSHVFILGKPSSPTSYLHMAGRTGRLSPNGFAQGKVIELIRENGWTESKMLTMYELLNIPVQNYDNVE
jgi:superfamily II DNA/RNA helicase